MSRHQEVFNKISDMLETEYDDCAFQEMCYELAKEIDELREVIRACAASPWRYDVENAPKDGSEIQAEFEAHKGTRRLFAEWDSVCDRWVTANGHYDDDLLIAFAIPNPPQVIP